jgi:catechol 2,3-dioxygenase-like lactoylglutathione lyase family enzyme
MIKTRALNHAALNISDVEKAKHFYGEILKLELLPRPDFPFAGAWYGTGRNAAIHLIVPGEIEPGKPNPTGPHLALDVEDFEAAKRWLKQHGIAYFEPQDFGMSPLAGRQLWVLDPDGNTIELRSDR